MVLDRDELGAIGDGLLVRVHAQQYHPSAMGARWVARLWVAHYDFDLAADGVSWRSAFVGRHGDIPIHKSKVTD